MAFSPDGKFLAAESTDNSIRVWEVASGQECLRLPGHTGKILSLTFAPDGQTLISGSDDTTALVWDLARLRRIRSGPQLHPAEQRKPEGRDEHRKAELSLP
jgi:WD40 repeat protein